MQYNSLTRAIYVQYRSLFDRTPAAALALVLVVLTAIVLVLEHYARGRVRYHRRSPGTARPAPRISLWRWRWPAFGFCAAAVGFALLLPLAVIVYWLERAVSLGRELGDVWGPALNSLLASTLTAGVAVAAALPVAVLAVRYQAAGRGRSSASRTPPTLFPASSSRSRSSSSAPTTRASPTRRWGCSSSPTSSASSRRRWQARIRAPPSRPAARGGRPRPGEEPAAFATVTAPLVTPGLLAGAALVFLSTMKELPPRSCLLRSASTRSPPKWTATTVAAYSEAALPALLLVVFSAPFVYG